VDTFIRLVTLSVTVSPSRQYSVGAGIWPLMMVPTDLLTA
jgi:hypothetical protein